MNFTAIKKLLAINQIKNVFYKISSKIVNSWKFNNKKLYYVF